MATQKSVSETLTAAAELIERDGWCQYVSTNNEGRRCAVGAINVAAGRDYSNSSYALWAMRQHIGESVAQWNDAPERTQAEVVAALREAAAKQ